MSADNPFQFEQVSKTAMPNESEAKISPSIQMIHRVEHLLDEIVYASWRREAAEHELRAMGSEAVDAIRAILDFESRMRFWKRAWVRNGVCVSAVGVALALVYPYFPLRTQDQLLAMLLTNCSVAAVIQSIRLIGSDLLGEKVIGALLIAGAFVAVRSLLLTLTTTYPQIAFALYPAALALLFYYLAARENTRTKPQVIDRAARFTVSVAEKRTAPLLIELEGLASFQRLGDIRKALTALLPDLTAADADLLTDAHRARLHHSLSRAGVSEPVYQIAILQALAHIGNATSIQVVQRLANSRFGSPVRDAARECLPLLRRRILEQGDSLLRASAAEGKGAKLLRAADGNSAAGSDVLLRATVGEPQDYTVQANA